MNTVAHQENLFELIDRLGMSVKFVASKCGWNASRFYRGPVFEGRVTLPEVLKLAEILRVDKATVEAAVLENERRFKQTKVPGGAV